jgi:hypothetical protein
MQAAEAEAPPSLLSEPSGSASFGGGSWLPPGKQHQIWWQLAAFVAVSIALVTAGTKFEDESARFLPESTTLTSTFNPKPSGYSGLFELAHRVGISCRRWQLPYRHLRNTKGMLIVISPGESLQDFELDQLLSWVAAGNKLMYLDSFSYSFSRKIVNRVGARITETDAVSDRRMSISSTDPAFAFVPSLTVNSDTRIEGGTALLKDSSGCLIAELEHGKGKILLGVVPALGANRHLSDESEWPNLQFLVNLFSTTDGDVLFDEICHGYSQAGNVFVYLGRGPAGMLFLQMLLILAVALGSTAQHFGAVKTVAAGRRLSSLEFINGLANTFRRAKAADLAFDVLNHSFRARLCKALAISSHEQDERLVEAWVEATGGAANEFRDYLASSTAALAKKHLTEEELIALVSACDKITEQSRVLFATKGGKPQ